MPHFEMMVQDQARIVWQSFQHNVSYQRFNLIGYINGEQADISLNGSFVLKKTDACDVFVRLFHQAGHNTSNQLFHALAYDQSVMNFNAQIAAGAHADQIQAYQMLRGIIMDEGAMIFARPQLDITYDDLACSHGVSIGGFDQESYFYLRSRGLAAKLAQQLLLQSYLSEPLTEGQRAQQWHHMISEVLAHE
jgi:Fe-S cluster assembly protein SufD